MLPPAIAHAKSPRMLGLPAREPARWRTPAGRWQGVYLFPDLPDEASGRDGSSRDSSSHGGEEPSQPLPPREPKPWWVHWAACTLAIFLVVVPFSLRNLGLGLLTAGVLGAIAMPFTQRIEQRHLAERDGPE